MNEVAQLCCALMQSESRFRRDRLNLSTVASYSTRLYNEFVANKLINHRNADPSALQGRCVVLAIHCDAVDKCLATAAPAYK
jgi:hypothetical protein